MRHIPEDELHAYLDQGLSRTQCVEIESHLADCLACRASRDRIAALRDRTTALLSRLAPPLRVPPSFDGLRRRAAELVSERRRRVRNVIWAASLVLAVGAGWTASSLVGPRGTPAAEIASGEPTSSAPSTAPAPIAREPHPTAVATSSPGAANPGPRAVPAESRRQRREPAPVQARPVSSAQTQVRDSVRTDVLAVLDASPAATLAAAPAPSPQPLAGQWRTLTWDGAEAEAARRLPHIGGLPVVKVQVQDGLRGSRPVTVVAQQLASGEVIQTIEGPAADVSQLLARRQASAAPGHARQPGDSTGQALGGTMAMQVGDRMLAITGALPTDSLRAMIRRLNAEMRSK